MVRRLAIHANAYVISLFDCCREVVEPKGGRVSISLETLKGQLYVIYSAAPGDTAAADLFLYSSGFPEHKLFPITLRERKTASITSM